jgi:glutamate N-acetyltransferase/amino-acid N-acetyltransferase
MSNKTSPLAPASYPVLPAIAGVRLAAAECNIRYKNRLDVLLVEMEEGTQAAGVFTTSLTAAAPVEWCRNILKIGLKTGNARALVVNAGNANAFTGREGMEAVEHIARAASTYLHCLPEDVYVASTGVIGEPLAYDKIVHAMPGLKSALGSHAWNEAAQTIMTTDTFMKVATATVKIGETPVTVNGFAKGSGMIAPNMATLLAFVFTDANIPAPVLQTMLEQANGVSFNCITVDGDTSTNDTLLAFATGKATHAPVKTVSDPHIMPFKDAFTALLTDLALQVVKDGEGAQKLVTVKISGAETSRAAHTVAMTVANSPLVKTAIAGEDANWGRVIGAIGRAGENIRQEKITVSIGGITVARDGARAPGYDEAPVNAHMKGRDIRIHVELGMGKGSATVYSCDLTHGYIDINGSYRS